MDQGSREPGEQGRLGREQRGDDTGRPHPPEQYPGYERESGRRDEDNRLDDRGYRDDGRGRQDERGVGGAQTYREERSGGTGWGIAALVVSILALLTSFVGLVTFIFAIPGIILGFVARRKGSRGLGLTSIILSVVAIVIGIVLTAIALLIFGSSPEFQQILQEAQQQ